MSSTNHTANYNLSQYVGSDKPTYLGDYNADMLAIDTQMKANNTLASNASTTASTASETAGTALTNAGTAQTTADNAQLTATSALNKALTNEANIANFNLTHFETFDKNNITITSGVTALSNETTLTVASNEDGSLCKVYGSIYPSGNANNQSLNVSVQSRLRPTTDIVISPAVIIRRGSSGSEVTRAGTVTIFTDGKVRITGTIQNGSDFGAYVLPCLYFVKDFGDVPQPE